VDVIALATERQSTRQLEKVWVILNPSASGGRGLRLQPAIEETLARRAVPFTLVRSEGPGHVEALSREAKGEGADLILAVGGDGTVHEVANGVLADDGKPPPLGVVPVGTGNDFMRMIDPRGRGRFILERLLSGKPHPFDVGRVRFDGGASYFVNLLGVGIDVEVLRKRADFRRLKGLPQYLAALISALVTFRPESFRVSLRGGVGRAEEIIEERTILTAVTVGPSVGGGFLLNPDAKPDDGALDLFFVKTLGMMKIARYIPRVIRGTHGGIPEILQRQIVRAKVERSDGGAFIFEMDGDRMPDPVRRLEIDVCPGVLPVLLPGGDG